MSQDSTITTLSTATIDLSSQPGNYRFIFITHGYYKSGFPSYSSILIPVAMLTYSAENWFSTGGYVNGKHETINLTNFSKTAWQISININNCFGIGSSNCFVAVYGIK